MPLLFRYRVLNKLPLSIGIGSYLGKYIETLSSTDPSLTKFKPIDLGIASQLDYDLIIWTKFSLKLIMKINFGLKDVNQRDIEFYPDYVWKNYNILFGLGLKF